MHPTPEELIDFVEQRIGVQGQRSVQEHLREGCRRCERRMREYRIIATSLREGPLEDPPPELSEAAVRLFAQFPPARGSVARVVSAGARVARLVFDSSRPDLYAPLTVRGAQAERRLRFEDDRLELDLLLSPVREGIQLTAQALHTEPKAEPAGGVRFLVQSRGAVIARGQCDEFGEFEALVLSLEDLQIILEDPSGPVQFDVPE